MFALCAMSDGERSGRKNGRPRKGDPPRVPYEDLDRILVFGEVVACEDGESTTVQYPSYRDLARRFGVSHSLIAQYAKKHDCMRRRKEAQGRIAARADQKLVELRADALALSKDDALRIIDGYLAGFEKALAEGRVRFDNPSDFNTMLRLKEFLQGGADSRQEVHASLSLEDIQARHQRMLRTIDASSAAMRGELAEPMSAIGRDAPESTDRVRIAKSPAPSFDTAAEKVTVHAHDHDEDSAERDARAAVREPDAPVGATLREPDVDAPQPMGEADHASVAASNTSPISSATISCSRSAVPSATLKIT